MLRHPGLLYADLRALSIPGAAFGTGHPYRPGLRSCRVRVRLQTRPYIVGSTVQNPLQARVWLRDTLD